MRSGLVAAVLAVALTTACAQMKGAAPPSGMDAQQEIYWLEGQLKEAIGAANAYAAQPRCPSGPAPGCSSPRVVALLTQGSTKAVDTVLDAASISRLPGATDDQRTAAVEAARAALAAFTAQLARAQTAAPVPSVPVKPAVQTERRR
jgi:hypothetical protein